MYKLLLIEDDTQLSKLIQENLERYGYVVHQPKNLSNLLEEFTSIKPETFFHLSEPANTEFFYPLSIGLFLLTIYLVIDFFRDHQTNRAIELILRNQFAELHPHTEEQKAFQQLLNKIIWEHTSKYNEMKERNKERLYFLSHWMHYLKTPVSVIELIIHKEEKTNETAEVFDKILQENKRLHT
ncbi:hypothetical protein [Peribacillus tepidiphilus]|uniref:hypothetical protein n=1 Tax=Peribacillus tepidiphilus TaxID=2652445 RepID=UPI0035B56EC2